MKLNRRRYALLELQHQGRRAQGSRHQVIWLRIQEMQKLVSALIESLLNEWLISLFNTAGISGILRQVRLTAIRLSLMSILNWFVAVSTPSSPSLPLPIPHVCYRRIPIMRFLYEQLCVIRKFSLTPHIEEDLLRFKEYSVVDCVGCSTASNGLLELQSE